MIFIQLDFGLDNNKQNKYLLFRKVRFVWSVVNFGSFAERYFFSDQKHHSIMFRSIGVRNRKFSRGFSDVVSKLSSPATATFSEAKSYESIPGPKGLFGLGTLCQYWPIVGKLSSWNIRVWCERVITLNFKCFSLKFKWMRALGMQIVL